MSLQVCEIIVQVGILLNLEIFRNIRLLPTREIKNCATDIQDAHFYGKLA